MSGYSLHPDVGPPASDSKPESDVLRRGVVVAGSKENFHASPNLLGGAAEISLHAEQDLIPDLQRLHPEDMVWDSEVLIHVPTA